MPTTNLRYGLKSYGMPVIGEGLGSRGTYFVDPTNGSDSYNGKSISRAKATLAAAYALTTANQNDVVYYIAGSSSLTLTAALTWSKSYTHLIGICAPTMFAQRARIFQLSTLTGASPLLNITGTGCIFKNFYIFQGVNDNTSLINVQVTGGRNYFENVHIAGIGNDTMDAANACSLKLNGAEECTFKNCAIGLDTVMRGTAANSEILLDGDAKRLVFDDCFIYAAIEHATNHPLVKLTDTTSLDRFLWFRKCVFSHFSTNKALTPGSVFSIPASCQTNQIILQNCTVLSGSASAPDWDSNDRGWIYNNAVAPAASGAGGLATNQ